MLKQRQGFTLIELLIVVVIIGILAAIAIPKFSATREKAYFSAMKSDLKNLQTQQEIYYNRSDGAGGAYYTYSNSETDLEFAASSGVGLGSLTANNTGWSATATHRALAATQFCAVFVGEAASVAPATIAGVVTCTGE
jgi:prepilin-type N-terminal cleavage/methylation domain-containing protein